MSLKMDAAALQAFLGDVFPQVADDFTVLSASVDGVDVRLETGARHLRPGGTVSGPTMFALADVGMYLAVLAQIGPEALAVTTNVSIDFMRKPPEGARLICTARVLKLGRALAVGDALIAAEGVPGPVARAGLTYSIPPKRA
jgi:uncharacterized protein (TIGR00369 family)